jgi:hypothetical protein
MDRDLKDLIGLVAITFFVFLLMLFFQANEDLRYRWIYRNSNDYQCLPPKEATK